VAGPGCGSRPRSPNPGDHGVAVGDPRDGYFEIYATIDGGNGWTRIPQGNIPAPLPTEFGLIPGPSSCARGDTIWFGTYADEGGRVFRSTDRGLTWTVASPNLRLRRLLPRGQDHGRR